MLASAAPARAEAPRDAPSEVQVDRDDAPVGRSEFGFESGAPAGDLGFTVGAGWLEHPIRFATPDGPTRPVRRRETVVVGAAISLGASALADVRFTGAHQVGDRLIGAGSTQPLDRWVPGDLRFGVRIRVLGGSHTAEPDDSDVEGRAGPHVRELVAMADRPARLADATPVVDANVAPALPPPEPPRRFTLFARGELTLPTGDEGDFAGEPSWSLAWFLIGRLALPHDVVVAASVGLRLRGAEVLVGDRVVGNEFLGNAGVAVGIPPIAPLWCRAEQVRATAEVAGIVGDSVGKTRGPSPVEARVGVVTQPRPWLTVAARVGTGLTDEIGAPQLRATVEVTYQR